MKIEVTQADIDKGQPCMAAHCPVARAIKRAGYPQAQVGELRVYLTFRTERTPSKIRNLPRRVRAWIKKYDHDGRNAVAPITFDLED